MCTYSLSERNVSVKLQHMDGYSFYRAACNADAV